MKHITLTYPILFGLRLKEVQTNHPDKWEELTPSQLVALARLMQLEITEEDLLMEMLGLSRNVIRKLDAFQRYKLSELLDFLKDRTPYDRFIQPEVMGLKAPADGLQDVSFGEFIHIDTFYMNYQERNHPDDCLNLVSCLYVFPDKAGKRPEFTGDITTHRAALMSEAQREAICINYGLIRTWLAKAYPEVFPEPKPGEKKQKQSGNGWVDVYDSLVGDDLVNSDKYANLSCTEVLRYMNKKIKESRKQKK